MSFIDTTLTPAAGYTYVHNGQIYDAVAARLEAHAGWTFIEYVDYIAATITNRTYVWKCSSASSGLPADFFVMFTVAYTTTGTVYVTAGGNVRMTMCERYDVATHTASAGAVRVTSTAVTIQADLTHPSTWVLSAILPNTATAMWSYQNLQTGSATSARLLISIASGSIVIYELAGGVLYNFYAGEFETILSASDDPMPLMLFGNSGALNGGTTTRHPKMVPGSILWVNDIYAMGYYGVFNNSSYAILGYTPLIGANQQSNTTGVLGDPTSVTWNLFLGGTPATKCVLAHGTVSTPPAGVNASTRGGLRGYPKNLLQANCAVHSFGDTFTIAGKSYAAAGVSSYALLDTTA